MDISVIVPVYNEEKNLEHITSRLTSALNPLNVEYEIIFINDGSRDDSLLWLNKLAKKHSQVRIIDFSRNFGHQIAVMAGIDHATGDAVAIIDADLQDPPELIPEMYLKLKQGYEVVYAKRIKRSGETYMKKVTAKLFYRILRSITSLKIPVDTGDFRIFDRKIAMVLREMPEYNKYLRGQIAWAGFKQSYIEYERAERVHGKTGYTYRKMMKFALDGITGFSNTPLKFATLAGFIVSFIAFIFCIYALYARFISKDYVEGWTSLILAVLFIGGIQLICIGIIGEYISRISADVRKRPLYVIRSTNFSVESEKEMKRSDVYPA